MAGSNNVFIALHYLRSNSKQNILAMMGVAIGVMTFIVMVNFMTGVNDFLDYAVFNGSPDVVISAKKKPNSGFQTSISTFTNIELIEDVLSSEKNILAYSHHISTPAILIGKAQQLPGNISGITLHEETEMVNLNDRLITGSGFESLSEKNTILLGISIAENLGVSLGDSLQMILPNGRRSSLKVAGIFSFGITTIDNVRTYVNGETLQELMGSNQLVNQLHIKLKDRDNVAIKEQLTNQFPNIIVTDWKDANKTIVVGNNVRNVLTWSVSFALLLVAGFGIFNILNNLVLQKRKDIAVLKTMGYSQGDITTIFLLQSLLIGITGALLGALLGFFVSQGISNIPLNTSDFIIVDTYPINFSPLFYVLGVFFGITTTAIAGYFPSRKASNVDPVTIIRGR